MRSAGLQAAIVDVLLFPAGQVGMIMVGFVPISGYKCSKNQSGRPDLNRRPLDPQSRRQVISMFPQIKPAHK